MSAFTDSVEKHLKGCEAFSVGACPGCDACGLSDEPTDDEYDLAQESSFSWSACDSCGSTFGGDRHPAHFLLEGFQDLPKDEREIHHCQVCSDCLYYHANGDEPEDWEKHP